ncbi:MAG: phosphoenolpyruvate carboxykinase, partial [Lentisphaerae bacterium]|nr:phosphoenolpyruvate carboxykinase [Lentisphaerota bacterium]
MDISKLKNKELKEWLQGWIDLCTPDEVVFCDGSNEQYDEIANVMVKAGVFIRLDEDKKPNSYAVRSDVGDVARVEERTYICPEKRADAGPSNNWCDTAEMRSDLSNGENHLYKGCMKGRTMYYIT